MIESRKLASIQKIDRIVKHPNADSLYVATVMGWQVLVKNTDDFKENDKVVYIEIDSVLPEDNSNFEFMKRHKYRVKSIKLRGELSQGLIQPMSILPDADTRDYDIGDDVTSILGITKVDEYADEIQSSDKRRALPFPSKFVEKTEEPRIQSHKIYLKAFQDKPWYATLKIDGTSGTFLINQDTDMFMVCSRNLQREENTQGAPDDVYWQCAKKFGIEKILRKNENRGLAIQGEIYGPQIGGNRLEVGELSFAVFNVWSISNRRYYGMAELVDWCETNNLRMVPIIAEGEHFNFTLPELLNMVKGKYPKSKNPREGLVFRLKNMDNVQVDYLVVRPSFKVINNDYLLKFD